MRIDIISAVPELLESPFQHSIIKRAQNKGLTKIVVHDLRSYGLGKHKKIDDYSYGFDAGMVLMIEPVDNCINALKEKRTYDEVIYLSPDGKLYNQKMANQLACFSSLILLCGHYKGIDQRIRDHLVTKEISVGDYVLSGGEIAAISLVDSLVRLIPGVLSNSESALNDSFQDGLIAAPTYTRPETYKEWIVPKILLSGNPKAIEEWQYKQALEQTKIKRPNLYKTYKNQ